MKKILVACIIVVGLVVIGFSMKHYLKPVPTGQPVETAKETEEAVTEPAKDMAATLPDIMHLLPEQTDFVIKLGSVRSFYQYLSVTENSVFGEPVEDLEEMKTALGFNPLVIEDLQAAGLDVDREIGLIFNDMIKGPAGEDDVQTNLFFFLPVTDAQKVKTAIINVLQKDTPSIAAEDQQNGITMVSEPGKPERAYMVEKGDYLFVGMNPRADARPFADAIMSDQNRLPASMSFQDVTSRLDSGKDLFFYADIKRITNDNLAALMAEVKKQAKPGAPDMTKSLEYLEDMEGAGISADFSGADLAVKGIVNVTPDSPTSRVMKDIAFDKHLILGIPDNPLLLMSWAVHMPTYYSMLLDSMPEKEKAGYKKQLEKTNATYGIDIEKDVIENIAGNLNLGVFDGMSINMMNYNLLLTLTLNDGDLFRETLDKYLANADPQVQQMVTKTTIADDDAWAVSVFGMVQLFITEKDNNLVLSVGKPMLEKAMAGDASTGFPSRIKTPSLAEKISADNGLMYLNFGELLKAAKNFSSMTTQMNRGKSADAGIEKALSRFDHLVSTSKIEGDTGIMDFDIKTGFDEPFFQGLLALIDELKALESEGQN